MFMPFTVTNDKTVQFMTVLLILWLGHSQVMIKQSFSLLVMRMLITNAHHHFQLFFVVVIIRIIWIIIAVGFVLVSETIIVRLFQCKGKVSIARSLPVENLLPQNVVSIIN